MTSYVIAPTYVASNTSEPPMWGSVTVSYIHRYSKYLLTYQSHFKDYDTFHETMSVIPPHCISEELVYSTKKLLETFSLEIWSLSYEHYYVLLHIVGLELSL